MRINKYLIDIFIVLLLVFFSFYLGKTYSIYHTDPWHWGSIASNAKDHINGFKLFKDIVLLWGPGQPILYNAINKFYAINYYSIGLITSLAYALNLILIYVILLSLSSRIIALTIILFVFSLVPYPQVPWPDFYSGICLSLSCFFLIIKSKNQNIYLLLSALFLVLSITFRNSYLITVIPAILFYILLHVFHRKEIPANFKKFFFFLFVLLFIFFFSLAYNDNLILWYEQGLGRVGEYKEVDSIILGYEVNSSLFLIIKFIYHIFFPARLENLYFLIIFFFNGILVLLSIIKKDFFLKILNENNKIIFLSILGLFGITQSFNQYEIWRHLNSSISLFFVIGFFLNKQFKNKKLFKTVIILMIIFSFTLFPLPKKNGNQYLSGTNYFPLRGFVLNDKFVYNPKLYSNINISFFNGHLFNEDHGYYYNELKKIICDYNKIINYSIDRTLGYICENKNSIISTYPRNNGRPIFHKPILETKFSQFNLDNNEIIVADKYFSNDNAKLLKIIKLPKYTRYTYSDTFMRYFDQELYIYVKK